jgi:hypothetical protein
MKNQFEIPNVICHHSNYTNGKVRLDFFVMIVYGFGQE